MFDHLTCHRKIQYDSYRISVELLIILPLCIDCFLCYCGSTLSHRIVLDAPYPSIYLSRIFIGSIDAQAVRCCGFMAKIAFTVYQQPAANVFYR